MAATIFVVFPRGYLWYLQEAITAASHQLHVERTMEWHVYLPFQYLGRYLLIESSENNGTEKFHIPKSKKCSQEPCLPVRTVNLNYIQHFM